MMDLQLQVNAFADETGLGPIEPDQNGFYHFIADEDMSVSVGATADGEIVLLTEVGDVPPEGREQFYQMLLEAMYGLRETRGATFQIVSNPEKVLLRQVVSAARAASEPLADRLNALADLQAEWRRRVADFRPPAEEGEREGESAVIWI